MGVRAMRRKKAAPPRLEDILESLREVYPSEELDLVRRAYVFSAQVHRGQERRSGDPYLSHPLAVAMVLTELRLDPVCVAVGLLHDVLEDTTTTRQHLEEVFGAEVAKLVEGVTKISRIEFSSVLEEQAVNFRKLLLAMVDDIRVLLVKLGDRLHNMRTLMHLSPDAQMRTARETSDIYAPLASRLGMGRMQQELEDLAFRYLEPEAYETLNRRVNKRLRAVQKFTKRIEQETRAALGEHAVHGRVQHRVKGLSSLHRKMTARNLTLDRVYDLVAFRIYADSVRNCYAALGIIHNLWNPVPGRFKDYIAMPKPNMYQSLQTTLIDAGEPFEVQIRTEEMHRIAEEGIAAHWIYKEGERTSIADDRQFAWLRQLVEWQQEVSDPREFLSSLKLDLYPDEVYVFTPKGHVKSLPRGATPIDFAYAIHTEIGQHCKGAKVDGKLVPLRQQLENGDIVEIITSPEATPSRDWLGMVMTSRARSKVRSYIKKREQEHSIELGKRILEKELRKHGLRLNKVLGDTRLEEIAQGLGLGRPEDLIAAIGYGRVAARLIVEKLLPATELAEPEAAAETGRLRRAVARAMGWDSELEVRVQGMDDILVYRSRCCGPVPGEPIVGYITRGKGVAVHTTGCPNLDRLLVDAARQILVVWRAPKGEVQPVGFVLQIEDRHGLLAAITARIAEGNTNIRHIESQLDDDGSGQIDLVLDVVDLGHLRKIEQALSKIPGVQEVRRGRGF